jgi:NTE family protein
VAEHERSPAPRHRPSRALVLGGGGSAGNAWEIGVLAGLLAAGLDVVDADLVVGTSAGATVAAQTAGTSAAELLAAVLAEAPPPTPSRPARSVSHHLERTSRIIAAAADPADMRRRMGAAALELAGDTGDRWSERWRATVAARLPHQRWPERRVLVPAVDARTGHPVVFDRYSGVDLVDAVAASTSSSLPYGIGDGRYLDGGYRRNENADLAAGHERVLVLSPFAGRSRHPQEWGMQLSAQVDELRAGGSAVELVFPDAAAQAAFGDDMMDLSARPPAARAGRALGLALAERLTAFWR